MSGVAQVYQYPPVGLACQHALEDIGESLQDEGDGQDLSRCSGRQSVARRVQNRIRSGWGTWMELMPSRLTPRRMKGMTVVSSSDPLANPILAILPSGLRVRVIWASISPPHRAFPILTLE